MKDLFNMCLRAWIFDVITCFSPILWIAIPFLIDWQKGGENCVVYEWEFWAEYEYMHDEYENILINELKCSCIVELEWYKAEYEYMHDEYENILINELKCSCIVELEWYKVWIQWKVHKLQKKGGAIHGICFKSI